jgi:hypothetical protein
VLEHERGVLEDVSDPSLDETLRAIIISKPRSLPRSTRSRHGAATVGTASSQAALLVVG